MGENWLLWLIVTVIALTVAFEEGRRVQRTTPNRVFWFERSIRHAWSPTAKAPMVGRGF